LGNFVTRPLRGIFFRLVFTGLLLRQALCQLRGEVDDLRILAPKDTIPCERGIIAPWAGEII
jgi:hypothetical protein